MPSLTEYNGIQVLTNPTGPGGLATNNNFKALSTAIHPADPTAGNDITQGFSAGSRWFNSTTTEEWICTDPTPGSAVWVIPGSAVNPAQQARVTFDGGGSALTGTPLVWFVCQFAGTLSGYTLLADQSGSIVIDVKKAAYTGFPTFSSITGSGTKPTLSSAQKSQDNTLTGWTTAVSAGDILQFQISSVSTVTHVQLFLNIV